MKPLSRVTALSTRGGAPIVQRDFPRGSWVSGGIVKQVRHALRRVGSCQAGGTPALSIRGTL